jgi:steroid 5-alpha reductase family enzyme
MEEQYIIEPGTPEFWFPLYCVLASHFLVFFIAACREDNGIIDIQWGLSFIIGNLAAVITRVQKGGAKDNVDTRVIITNVLVGIWGLRMAIHVAMRTELGNEDRRFKNLRA